MRNRSLVETRVLTHCKCIQITRQRHFGAYFLFLQDRNNILMILMHMQREFHLNIKIFNFHPHFR